jgi:NAD(P)H-nitrite reductase large subunit
VRLHTEAEKFLGSERVEGVSLANGETLTADVYVTATGVQPNVDFLESSGIDCGWGIRVDDRLSTNVEGVYAAGDVAETHDRLTGERYVHAIFPNAVAQAEIVAANVLGHDLRYEGAEAMNSLKHLGLPVMAVGAVAGDETLRWQSGAVLRHLVLQDDRLIGFRLVGDVERGGLLRSLMLRRLPIGRFKERLLRGDFGFADLALTLPTVA